MVEKPNIKQPPETIEIPEEFRSELDEIMRDLLTHAQELAFEYSTLDCPKILECTLAQKSKELFKDIKRLNEVAKKYAPKPPKVTYTR
jgi:hypothetical protein